MTTFSSSPCSIAKNIHTDYDKRQLAYICGSDKAIAERVDSGATLFGASKNDTEIKLHGDGLGSVYDFVKVIAETSGCTQTMEYSATLPALSNPWPAF